VEYVERRIVELRGRRVLIDFDLAALYGVETRRLNEQVKRNSARFPDDFVFQVTEEEKAKVIAECDHLSRLRFSPHLPLAFTEHGALMCSWLPVGQLGRSLRLLLPEVVLPCGSLVSVFIVRAFVRLRSIYASHIELTKRLDELDAKVGQHDVALRSVVEAIRQLMSPPATGRPPIGYGS